MKELLKLFVKGYVVLGIKPSNEPRPMQALDFTVTGKQIERGAE